MASPRITCPTRPGVTTATTASSGESGPPDPAQIRRTAKVRSATRARSAHEGTGVGFLPALNPLLTREVIPRQWMLRTLSRWRHGFESRWGCFILTTK